VFDNFFKIYQIEAFRKGIGKEELNREESNLEEEQSPEENQPAIPQILPLNDQIDL